MLVLNSAFEKSLLFNKLEIVAVPLKCITRVLVPAKKNHNNFVL